MTKKTQAKYFKFIENNTIKCDISYRGGSLKIDVSELFPSIDSDEAIMGAYQNYLGGGIAGAIVGGSMFDPNVLNKKERKVFDDMKEACKKYFYMVNNGGGDDYMQENVTGKDVDNGYERLQKMPVSAY